VVGHGRWRLAVEGGAKGGGDVQWRAVVVEGSGGMKSSCERRGRECGLGARPINYLGLFGGTETFGGPRKKTAKNYISFNVQRWIGEIKDVFLSA
jgi:hypothetical protein